MRGFDSHTMGAAFAGPGMDTRQWVSYGTVMAESGPDDRASTLDDGQWLVNVTLHPSGVEVPCRVAGTVAGSGEGEWSPFVQGDEVIVVVPQGDERAGCCIVGRLNNSVDAHPGRVAGQTAGDNTFAYKRTRTPYILETGSSYLVRNAAHGAFISMPTTGEVTIANGDKAFLTLGLHMLSLQNGDADCLIQIDLDARDVLVEAKGSKFHLNSSEDSKLFTAGRLLISTSGGQPVGHAVTAEQVVVFVQAALMAMGSLVSGVMVGGAVAGAAPAIVAAAVATAAATPLGAATGAMQGALATPGDPGRGMPGFGVAGLLLG